MLMNYTSSKISTPVAPIKQQLTFDSKSQIDVFLDGYGRKRKIILGDGNCLFRSFSFILYSTEEKCRYIREAVVEVISLNEECFKSYCLPETVAQHVEKMRNDTVWGTHAEIFAFSVLVFRPVFVATEKHKSDVLLGKAHVCTVYSVSIHSSEGCR